MTAPEALRIIDTEFVCDCEEYNRSACAGLGFYSELQGKRYCVLHFPSKDKIEDFKVALQKKLDAKDYNFRELWFPDEVKFQEIEFSGPVDFSEAQFSGNAVFHKVQFNGSVFFFNAKFKGTSDFSKIQFSKTVNFISSKFSGYTDFSDAQFFGEAGFRDTRFIGNVKFYNAKFSAAVDFISAQFSGYGSFWSAHFSKRAIFISAQFSQSAYFVSTRFKGAVDFSKALFSGPVDFSKSQLSENADFSSSVFNSQADFRLAEFGALVDFKEVTFYDYVRFSGDGEEGAFKESSQLNLQYARIDKPARVSFHTVNLRPYWFINVDASKFIFTNVRWFPIADDDKKATLSRFRFSRNVLWVRNFKNEIKLLKSKELSTHRLLTIAYRQLAINAEENHRYEEASRFRYCSMEAERLENSGGIAFWQIRWWYWLASGYGERVFKAFVVLLAIWIIFAYLYTHTGFVNDSLDYSRSLLYSMKVMLLQKPEPKPATFWADAMVILQMILGPLQAALLALAVRRKFKR